MDRKYQDTIPDIGIVRALMMTKRQTMLRNSLSLLLLVLMWASSGRADDCGPDKNEICASKSAWYEAKRARLQFKEKGATDYSDWLFTIPDRLNLSIEIDQKYPNATIQGTIMLVSGRLMITKGLDLKPGYEIDALDGPILMYQLAISLLDQAFPNGPGTVIDEHSIHKNENERGIRIATMSASGRFQAPWTLTGKVRKITKEKISYDLAFTFPAGETNRTWLLSGFWENPKAVPGFDESMSIEGWNIHSLGPITIKREGGTILDYGAEKKVLDIKTLGQLKRYIVKQEKSSIKPTQPTPKSDAADG